MRNGNLLKLRAIEIGGSEIHVNQGVGVYYGNTGCGVFKRGVQN